MDYKEEEGRLFYYKEDIDTMRTASFIAGWIAGLVTCVIGGIFYWLWLAQ